MKMTRFGATGKNVLASKRKVDFARAGERRIEEDETISTAGYKNGERVTAAKKGPVRPKPTKVTVVQPKSGKTISVSSRSALVRKTVPPAKRSKGQTKSPPARSQGKPGARAS